MSNTDNPYSNVISPGQAQSQVDAATLDGASLSTDRTFADESDELIPTQKATYFYVEDQIIVKEGEITDAYEAADLVNYNLITQNILDERTAGNVSGNIPISNGTLCDNLNADELDGEDKEYFEPYYNYIFNPDGNIDQDGYSGSTVVASGTEYSLDGFKAVNSGTTPATWKVYRDTSNLQTDDLSESCLRVEVTAASSGPSSNDVSFLYLYPFPVWNNKYRGETFTFAFDWNVEAGEVVRVGFNDSEGATFLELVGDGSWNTSTLTKTIDATATDCFLTLRFCNGTAYSVGVGNYYFKQMRFYKGSDYKPYDPMGPDFDLYRCMSLYYRSYDYGTAPGAVTSSGAYIFRIPTISGLLTGLQRNLPVPMISDTVSVTWYSTQTGTADRVYDSTGTTDLTFSSNNNENRFNTGHPITNAVGSANSVVRAHVVVDCRP